MATIPRGFNEVSGTIQPGALPTQTSGVTRDMVSAEEGFGKEIGVAADAVQKFAVARQGKLDLEEFEGTMAAYKTWELERKRTAYSNKMHDAKNIFESEKAVMDNWLEGDGSSSHQAFKQKHDGMSDRQKRRIALAIKVRQPDYMNAIGIHQDQQTDAAVVDSSKSSIGAATTSYAAAATPEEMKRELDSIDSSVEAMGAVNDWDSKRIDEERILMRSTAHEARIQVMLSERNQDPKRNVVKEVVEYIKAHEGQLTKASMVTVNKAMRAKAVISGGIKHMRAALSSEEPLKYLRDNKELLKDPEMQKEAIYNYNRIQGLKTKQDAEERKRIQNAVYDAIWKENKGIDQIENAMWSKLPAGDKEVFRKMALARDTEWPTVTPQNNALAKGAIYKFANENPKEFATNYPLALTYWGRLDKQSFDEMIKYQQTMIQNQKKFSSNSIGEYIGHRVGTVWGDQKEKARANQYRIDLNNLLGDMTRKKGEQPTREEFIAEANKMTTNAYKQAVNKTYPIPYDASGDPKDPRTLSGMLSSFYKLHNLRDKNDADRIQMGAIESKVNAAMKAYMEHPSNPHGIPMNNNQIADLIKRYGNDKVMVRESGSVFGSYWPNEVEKTAAESDGKPGRFVKAPDRNDEWREVPTDLLDNLSPEMKRQIGAKIAEGGEALTYFNKAKWYLQLSDGAGDSLPGASKKRRTISVPGSWSTADGTIVNPSGGSQISFEDIKARFERADSLDELSNKHSRKEFRDEFGVNAYAVYLEMLKQAQFIESSKGASVQPEEDVPPNSSQKFIPPVEGAPTTSSRFTGGR